MNYASVVFAGFAAISAIWYFAHARKNFKGPIMEDFGSDTPSSIEGVGISGQVSKGDL